MARPPDRDRPAIQNTRRGDPAAASPLPCLVGHRGVAAQAPENTLAGLRLAAALGYRAVEFDVRLTADRRLVLMHDDRLDRTTDGSGRVAETPFAAVSALDAGAWFSDAFAGEPVPSLEQTLALLVELDLHANIEIKADPGAERAAGHETARVVEAHWPRDREPPLVSSFQAGCLSAVRQAAPALPIGFLVSALGDNWRAVCSRLGCRSVHCNARWINRRNVAGFRDIGLPLVVYTVNDPRRAQELLRLGVSSVITDGPAGFVENLAGAGFSPQRFIYGNA